ncbi:hypothetical protein [Formosa haliotis]|uniref:hypothetical protein n=1 Tax=Formosa haliotis TaxID=1555194 RepID=UPI0011469892|nr:hypothetical protein [Formosa haliotis]
MDYDKIFLSVLVLLVFVNVIAEVSQNSMLTQITNALFVPLFVVVYLLNAAHLSVFLISFLSFSFLGDVTSVYYQNSHVLKSSNLFYFLSYLSLLGIVAPKFKGIQFGKLIGGYLLIVFLINAYLMFQLYMVLEDVIFEPDELTFFALRNITLIVLGFVSFAVYLNSDSSASILCLVMSICLIFSEVLFYIRNYYISDWTLVLLDRSLYGLSLACLYYYMKELTSISSTKMKKGPVQSEHRITQL